ncbi:MAG: acetyl-CoA carboxylase biotin carboxylase subunit, partial [Candidatus Melainabacteria bacterium]|nr:acetyl-CoA carboxylase biotin carboxylase subunit [Candidatus Melainabacteria bacterium]
MFKKVLVANRGEIAVRVNQACRELDVKVVAIYSEADRASKHVQVADEAWLLQGQPARVYLDIAQIIDLAKRAQADAIHPGYGFLAENAQLAQACQDAGVTFVGPQPDVIAKLGSKVESRRLMGAAGVPVVPGTVDPVDDFLAVKQLGAKYGYPIAIKAAAGGGGRGLRVVSREEDVEQAFVGAQREGTSYFGNGQVYVEKYLDRPRHIEVQILADHHGHVVHLGERDCSSQRRHQKLLEESPAPNLDPSLRERLLAAAVRGVSSIGYTSAGTVECLVSGSDFYFLEVNTRIQVEHPVTEFTTGIDIVKEQILIAANEPLSICQSDVLPRGHAIECRINAEDPSKNFIPSPGTITKYCEPQMPWVRIDSACYNGYQVLPFYDSLLAKLIVWGRTRDEAIARVQLALEAFEIEGVHTTIPFHLMLMGDSQFRSGNIYTTYVESELRARCLELKPRASSADIAVITTQDKSTTARAEHAKSQCVRKGPRKFEIEVNERQFNVAVTELLDPAHTKLANPSASTRLPVSQATKTRQSGVSHGLNHSGEIRSAMHGIVKEILVGEGDTVSCGQKLLILEAMKM